MSMKQSDTSGCDLHVMRWLFKHMSHTQLIPVSPPPDTVPTYFGSLLCAIQVLYKRSFPYTDDDHAHQCSQVVRACKLSHPNILKLYEAYEDERNLYLVIEQPLIVFLPLYNVFARCTSYTERTVATIMQQVILAVEHLHENGIVHLGLNARVFYASCSFACVKLVGLPIDDAHWHSHGSFEPVAPELLDCENYSYAVDMWSIGRMMYALLCGHCPFEADNDPSMFKKVICCSYSFEEKHGWNSISTEAKDLIRCLLVREDHRLTASQSLAHPWFNQLHNNDMSDMPQLCGAIQRLRSGIFQF